MDAVSQKASMSVCKEARKPPPAKHWVREGLLRSEVDGSLVSVHPDQQRVLHDLGVRQLFPTIVLSVLSYLESCFVAWAGLKLTVLWLPVVTRTTKPGYHSRLASVFHFIF